MEFPPSPSTNLKKLQILPPTSHWKNNESVWTLGDLILYTRNYGLIDKVSSESRRAVVLTRKGTLILYMKDSKGFVVNLHSSTALLMTTDKARLKKKNVLINRCKMKIRFPFGTINVTLYEGEIEKWRNALYAVLDGKELDIVERTLVPADPPRPAPRSTMTRAETPPQELPIDEEKEEESEISQTDISSICYDRTSEMDESINRPCADYDTYTIDRTEQPTERSEVVPHSDLLSDPPTPPQEEDPTKDQEPTPIAPQASFPPHRTAGIAFIRPHPPRNLPVWVPPSDGTGVPPPKPPRLSLSKIPVMLATPSPLPRRSKTSKMTASVDALSHVDEGLRKVSRAATFKSTASNDSNESRMPYYKGRAQYVQRSPKDSVVSVVSTANIELMPHDDRKKTPCALLKAHIVDDEEGDAKKEEEHEMCAHLEDPVRTYIKACYEQTLKGAREKTSRTAGMDSKISFFEQAGGGANRAATMPRKVARPNPSAAPSPATLPRSTPRSASSRGSVLGVKYTKESTV